MDRFKEHLRSIEDQLDLREPSDGVLDRIEARLGGGVAPSGRVVRFAAWRWVAAASVLMMISVSVLFFSKAGEKKEQPGVFAHTDPVRPSVPTPPAQLAAPAIRRVPSEAAEPARAPVGREVAIHKSGSKKPRQPESVAGADDFTVINALISQQMAEIRAMPVYVSFASNFSSFKKDLAQLDRDEKDLKQRIRQHGPAPEDLEALINIYQQKIQVLKCLKSEVLKTGNHLGRSAAIDSAAHSIHA